jgi:hypothetical protein
MINNITMYFAHKKTYNKVIKHLEQIIDNCDYNYPDEDWLNSKGDIYADNYFYDLIFHKGIRPEWMKWVIN